MCELFMYYKLNQFREILIKVYSEKQLYIVEVWFGGGFLFQFRFVFIILFMVVLGFILVIY